MSEKVPMTPEGQARLREELKRLREVELPQVVKDIGTAREHGDLSENAEYHAAKERQGLIHSRITFLEQTLSRAEVIDPSKLSGSKIQFGARVKLLNLDNDKEESFQIVGPEEADIKVARISVASPLARQYYFMWLFFPMAVLIHRAAYDGRPAVRLWTWISLAVAGLLMCLSFPVFPNDLQAWGNNLAATVVMGAGLVWHLLHPPMTDMAGSVPQAELKLAAQSGPAVAAQGQ